ncbi:MAG: NACHT domain-containing protein, partial [Chloroflexota bacterium]|nr:NACHT domain-containing protein [Chloroflexota bacterium]
TNVHKDGELRKIRVSMGCPPVGTSKLEFPLVYSGGVPCSSSIRFSPDYSTVRKNTPYRAGDVFVRRGASTVRLESSEVPYLFQWDQAAYLEQEEWQQIIRAHLTGDFEKMQNLSPPFHPRAKASDLSAFDAVLRFLNAGKRLVVVKGGAGGGKTVLLHRIAYALANQHNLDVVVRREHFGQADETEVNTETVASVRDELEVTPSFPVPIFMALRAAFGTVEDFRRQLLAQIQEWTDKDEIGDLDQIFKIPGSKWIILLDGIDEMRDREEFAPRLLTWTRGLRGNVQVVVTSRPAYAEFDLPDKATVEIEPLTQEESLCLLTGNLPEDKKDEDKKREIEDWIRRQPGLLEMLTCPRALVGLVMLLNPAISAVQTQRDQNLVEVVETRKPSLESAGSGDAPSLDVLPNENQSDLAGSEDEEEPPDKWIPLQLALAVQSIVTFMREEEIKRRDDWGQKARKRAQQAQMELDETAWRSDWDADGFDSKECERNSWITRESCEWNEEIGFIRDKYPRRYRFMCNLLHYYFCVEYAYDFEVNEEEIKETMIHRGTNRPATQSVLILLNQIRLANRRDLLNFT